MLGIILLLLVSDTLRINLEQAKEKALEANPLYRMELLSHRHSNLGLYENLLSNILRPTVGVTYSDATRPYVLRRGYNFSLSMDQPLFDLSLLALILQSKSNVSMASYLLRETKNRLYYQVEAEYLTVLKAENLVEMQEKALSRAEENMRAVTKRWELGQVSKLELLNAEVYLNRIRLNLFTTKRDFQITKRILLNTLGIEYQYELLLEPVEIEEQVFYLPDLDTLIKIGLENRPRIRSVKEEVEQRQIGFWSSISSFLPRVSYRWDWSYNSPDFPQNFSTIRDGTRKSSGWYVSANLNLFSWPFQTSKMKTSLEKSRLNLAQERLSLVREIKEVWLDCLTLNENLKLARSMFEAAKEASELAKTQYRLGLITTLVLFRAETDLLEAEATYLSALYDIKLIRSRLRYVVGG